MVKATMQREQAAAVIRQKILAEGTEQDPAFKDV